jgi:arylsulfatase A-like enzyme
MDTWVGQRTVEWLDAYVREQPFFLQVGFPGPHSPWDAPASAVARYRDAPIPLGSTRPPERPPDGPLRDFLDMWYPMRSIPDDVPDESIVACRRAYYAAITLIDEQIGAIRAALERIGRLDTTWLVYTTDHGEMMGDHRMYEKVVFYEPSVRVPLIVRPPAGMSGAVVDGIVEQIDVSATLRAIAGAGDVPGSEGRSLLADLTPRPPSLAGKGETSSTRDASANVGDDKDAQESILASERIQGTAFPAREGGRGVRPVAHSENHGFAAFIAERYKLVVWEERREPVQLFDLVADPAEDRNVVDEPEYSAVRAEMIERFVRPFLAHAPVRLGPPMVERRRARQARALATSNSSGRGEQG